MQDGSILRRNSKFIRKLYTLSPYAFTSSPDVGINMNEQDEGNNHSFVPRERTRKSRYGRALKPKQPTDYDDL